MSAERSPQFPVLERITALVLFLVLVSLVWMAVAAFDPTRIGPAALEMQAWVAVILLSAALILVSVVALLHTR